MRRFGVYLGGLARNRGDSQGIVNYALGLVRALPPLLAPGESLVVAAERPLAVMVGDAGSQSVVVVELAPQNGVSRRLLASQVEPWHFAREYGLSTIHYPKGFASRLPITPTKTIITVHDDIPFIYGARLYGGGVKAQLKAAYIRSELAHSLRHADCVLTVSAATSAAIREAVPDFMGHPIVTGQGTRFEEHGISGRSSKAGAIIILVSDLPHKRSREGLAFASRYATSVDRGMSLRIIGRAPRTLRVLPNGLPIERSDWLDDDALARSIATSDVLVFSSEREGFGLPPLESWLLGTPAVRAASGAVDEVLAGIPGRYIPGDYDSFRSAMDDVMTLSWEAVRGFRDDLVRRYSWRSTAEATIRAYRNIPAQ